MGWRGQFWNELPGICNCFFSRAISPLLVVFLFFPFFIFFFFGWWEIVAFWLSIELSMAENSSEFPVKHPTALSIVQTTHQIFNPSNMQPQKDAFFE